MFFELLLSSCYDVFENKPLLASSFSKIKVFSLYVHTEMLHKILLFSAIFLSCPRLNI